MALTVLFALGGSLVLSLTLMPVLAYLGLPRNMQESDVWLVRILKWIYRPMVASAVRRPLQVVAMALAAVAISIPIAMNLGAEFMPRLDEGDMLIEATRLPSASLEDSVNISSQIETIVKQFPQVKTVFCKTGRPEIANDVMGVHQTDVWVLLRPREQWPEPISRDDLIAQMSERLNDHVPGVAFGFTQPIEMRVDELVAGVKADVAVMLYGDDMDTLVRKSKEVERVLRDVPGSADVKADYQANIPTVTITALPDELARYGIDATEVMNVAAAIGGYRVGQIHEGRARFPLVIGLAPAWRQDMELLRRVPVRQVNGHLVTLDELADIRMEESPPTIEHEAGRRRTFIQVNVRGRDVASFVQEARRRVQQQVPLPVGYALRWGGDFENLQSASLRLLLITPLVLLLIWLLLFTTFKSVSLALLIFLAVPMAASGGILALWLRDALQHLGGSWFYCPVWRCRVERFGMGQWCRGHAFRGHGAADCRL